MPKRPELELDLGNVGMLRPLLLLVSELVEGIVPFVVDNLDCEASIDAFACLWLSKAGGDEGGVTGRDRGVRMGIAKSFTVKPPSTSSQQHIPELLFPYSISVRS